MEFRQDDSKQLEQAGKISFIDRIKALFEKDITVTDAKKYASWVAFIAIAVVFLEIARLFI